MSFFSSPPSKSNTSLFGRRKGAPNKQQQSFATTTISAARVVQCFIAISLLVLLSSNLFLWRNRSAAPPPSPLDTSSTTTLRTSSRLKTAIGTSSTDSKNSVSNCELRRYPPHRYYHLHADNAETSIPDFLQTADYVYGAWPFLLPHGPRDITKVCVDQSEWRQTPTATLPFADGTNPSILSVSRIQKQQQQQKENNIAGKNDNEFDSVFRAFPQAQYVATACMTGSQCSWNDSEQDRAEFRLSNQTTPDVVLTVVLLLNAQFETIAQSTLRVKRNAPWGENPRRRIPPHPTEYHTPGLDDARLFYHDGKIWLSYRQGIEFGYDVQVLNPIHWSVDDVDINNNNDSSNFNNKRKPSFSAILVASETASFCCGRNMALLEQQNNSNNKLQSLTWVDPVTVVDVDTTPLLLLKQQKQTLADTKRRRLLSQEEDTTTSLSASSSSSSRITVMDNHTPFLTSIAVEEGIMEVRANDEGDDVPQHQQHHKHDETLFNNRRRLLQGEKKPKKKASHVHGTNAFMVFLEQEQAFLGVAHWHRPNDRGPNPYARHGHHYTHAFFTISATPPFQLVALSAEFLLPSIVGGELNDAENIQFASGLEFGTDEKEIVIAYGINDCEAAVTTLPLDYVHSLLRPVESGKEVVDYMEKLKSPGG